MDPLSRFGACGLGSAAPRVMSLRNVQEKMSKSAPSAASRIMLNDTDDQIRKKIRRAITAVDARIVWEPEAYPGVANLLRIHRYTETIGPVYSFIVGLVHLIMVIHPIESDHTRSSHTAAQRCLALPVASVVWTLWDAVRTRWPHSMPPTPLQRWVVARGLARGLFSVSRVLPAHRPRG